jgi:hypothetical protein
MLKEINPGFWKGEYIFIEDRGPISPKAKTRSYDVTSKSGQLLGYVKWMLYWRKYAFYTTNVILEEECMSDISQFIKDRTAEQRLDWKKKSIVDYNLVESWKNEGGK